MAGVLTHPLTVLRHVTSFAEFMENKTDEARLNDINNSVRTSKRTPHFTITKINWLTLFKEIIVN
jgi:hypothetical protein